LFIKNIAVNQSISAFLTESVGDLGLRKIQYFSRLLRATDRQFPYWAIYSYRKVALSTVYRYFRGLSGKTVGRQTSPTCILHWHFIDRMLGRNSGLQLHRRDWWTLAWLSLLGNIFYYSFLWERRWPADIEVLAFLCMLSGIVWSTALHQNTKTNENPC
jgi:hypothetical protein